jgi:hypothetical protein
MTTEFAEATTEIARLVRKLHAQTERTDTSQAEHLGSNLDGSEPTRPQLKPVPVTPQKRPCRGSSDR